MGQLQRNVSSQVSASSRGPSRWSPQKCLRKGCQNVFSPRRWNQRFCRDEHCRRERRRWQNAHRQQRRRRRADVRQQHAEQERARRVRRREAARQALTSPNPQVQPTSTSTRAGSGAWSRRKKNSEPFCRRPGCYEPLPNSGRPPRRYCGRECASAMRRVQERERKRLRRHVLRVGRMHRSGGGSQAGSPSFPTARAAATTPMRMIPGFTGEISGVRNSLLDGQKGISSRLTSDVGSTESAQSHSLEEAPHDRETSSHPRPRPPPTS